MAFKRTQKIQLSTERLQIVIPGALLNYSFVDNPDKDGIFRAQLVVENPQICTKIKQVIEDFAAAGSEEMGVDVEIGGLLENEKIEITAKSSYEPNKAYRLGCENKEFYSGAPVDAAINCYFYQYAARVGLAYGLYALCKLGEGKRIGGFNAENVFGGDFIDAAALE